MSGPRPETAKPGDAPKGTIVPLLVDTVNAVLVEYGLTAEVATGIARGTWPMFDTIMRQTFVDKKRPDRCCVAICRTSEGAYVMRPYLTAAQIAAMDSPPEETYATEADVDAIVGPNLRLDLGALAWAVLQGMVDEADDFGIGAPRH